MTTIWYLTASAGGCPAEDLPGHHSQPKYHREAGIDENQNTWSRELPVVQGDMTVHSEASSRTCPASTTTCRCATRLACWASYVTHNTARPVRRRALISDLTAATEAAIEGCGRLVEQHHLWPHHQRTDECEPQSLPGQKPCDRPRLCLFPQTRSLSKASAAVHWPKMLADGSAHQPGSAVT
jgi:hypothetical protein